MYSILDYGARSGEDCTVAIQAALQHAGFAGGGEVAVPSGVYEFSSLRMPGRTALRLERGAVLRVLDDISGVGPVGFYHNELGEVTSCIWAMDAEDVSICGEGIIDLNGSRHFDPARPIIPEAMRGRVTPEQSAECTWAYDRRVNQPVFFARCSNVRIDGVTIRDSPCWTLTFALCRGVRISDITIFNHPNVPNNDGVHICSTSDVMITGCRMDCADDCVAVTSIVDWDVPCENIAVSDCILRSFSKAIVLGYMHSVVRRVTVSSVTLLGCNRGLTIMSCARSGLVEDVTFANCYVGTRIRAGNWWGNGEPVFIMAVEKPGWFYEAAREPFAVNVRNIRFSNIICDAENGVGVIGGGQNISHIRMDGVSVRMHPSANMSLKGRVMDLSPSQQSETIPQDGSEYWLVVRGARDVRMDDVCLLDSPGYRACIADCADVTMQGRAGGRYETNIQNGVNVRLGEFGE